MIEVTGNKQDIRLSSKDRTVQFLQGGDHATYFMKQVSQGDDQAFSKLHQCYVLRIVAFFHKCQVNSTAVDDLTQEVFTRVWEKRANYRSGTLDYSYLIGFARLILLEHQNGLRSRRTNEFKCAHDSKLKEIHDSPQANAATKEIHEDLQRLLSTLPEKQRQALKLKYLQGLSTQEASQCLACTESTVRDHCRLGLMKLGKWLKEHNFRAKAQSRQEKKLVTFASCVLATLCEE